MPNDSFCSPNKLKFAGKIVKNNVPTTQTQHFEHPTQWSNLSTKLGIAYRILQGQNNPLLYTN